MTKKDYELIALMMNAIRHLVEPDAYGQPFARFISDMCTRLEEDNPRFDERKFTDAVYRELVTPSGNLDITNETPSPSR